MKTLTYMYHTVKIYLNKLGNLVFEVYHKPDKCWYKKIVQVQDKYDHLEEIPGYAETLDSLEKNILSIEDPDNLDMSGFEDYGIENGWGKYTETPRLDKYREDREKNKYLCVLDWEVSLGKCYTKYINWTYRFSYSCDSSD